MARYLCESDHCGEESRTSLRLENCYSLAGTRRRKRSGAYLGANTEVAGLCATFLTQAEVADGTAKVHNRPTMTLKNAALLALIGTTLITALLLWTFVFTFLNVLRDLVPAVALLSSFIHAFGCFCVAVFFFVFYKSQS
jgi:hypothetical protein